jgi:hypothetical protein
VLIVARRAFTGGPRLTLDRNGKTVATGSSRNLATHEEGMRIIRVSNVIEFARKLTEVGIGRFYISIPTIQLRLKCKLDIYTNIKEQQPVGQPAPFILH